MVAGSGEVNGGWCIARGRKLRKLAQNQYDATMLGSEDFTLKGG